MNFISFDINNLWKDRLSMNFRIDASLNFDLQRYTYSSFNFGLVMVTKVSNFLDLGFSFTSVNSQIYQYFQWLPFFTADVQLPPGVETNFFTDLFNSFRFDNDALRRSSGFKAKTLTLDLVHHLGDWNATLRVNLAPFLDQTTSSHPVWKHNYQIAFVVQWIPIQELKTEFTYDEDKFTFR